MKSENDKAANRRWQAANRAHINAQRRKRRQAARIARMLGKHCLLCDIFLEANAELDTRRSDQYCRKCHRDYPLEVRRHKWQRYYKKNKKRINARKKNNKVLPGTEVRQASPHDGSIHPRRSPHLLLAGVPHSSSQAQ